MQIKLMWLLLFIVFVAISCSSTYLSVHPFKQPSFFPSFFPSFLHFFLAGFLFIVLFTTFDKAIFRSCYIIALLCVKDFYPLISDHGRFPFEQNFRTFGNSGKWANGTEIIQKLLNFQNVNHSTENSRNPWSKVE